MKSRNPILVLRSAIERFTGLSLCSPLRYRKSTGLSSYWTFFIPLVLNLLLVYILYMLCRVIYVLEFWDLYAASWHDLSMGLLLKGALRFDSSAIFYTNAPYALLVILSYPFMRKPKTVNCEGVNCELTIQTGGNCPQVTGHRLQITIHNSQKWLFVVVNALMLGINLIDTVYSRYTGRRTTWTFFSEFSNEGNLGDIFFIEVLRHWYLLLAFILFVFLLIVLYRPVKVSDKPLGRKAISSFVFLLLYVPVSVIAMRGGASTAVRPITVSNANQYVNDPSQAAIVLNTPFSLIRTCGKTTFTDPGYFAQDQLDAIYSPIHGTEKTVNCEGVNGEIVNSELTNDRASHNSQFTIHNSQLNVVVLIVESLAMEYVGFYNNSEKDNQIFRCSEIQKSDNLKISKSENLSTKSHTPFLDSLISQSLTFRHCYANGRKSIDGMPSVLSGIPMFVEPFFVTGYSLNDVDGIAAQLSRRGYSTAFFHGAENGSMGFEAFARTSGFAHYYGRTEYDADSRFGGEKDFDGTWAIWDEEFLQYYALTMSSMRQPFMTALFTATSHHPFVVPERYRKMLHEEGHPMYTCIRYTDMALRRFFATASQQPWYDSTIFVITADHTNITEQPAYSNNLGTFSVPIIIFDPSGQLPRGVSPAVAQQTDIMPTILGLVGAASPYVAYGIDLLSTPPDSTWALHYNNGLYQHVQQGRLLLFDGEKATGYYDIDADPQLRCNLLTPAMQGDARYNQHLAHTKAIIQSYMQRMTRNQLKL